MENMKNKKIAENLLKFFDDNKTAYAQQRNSSKLARRRLIEMTELDYKVKEMLKREKLPRSEY